jgi:FkbM family methyltransferase
MKIAVYTIALNEEKHVKQWFESAKEADLILIADTGSSDKTRFIAKSLGIDVHSISVDPWRFDVARNASLALIPGDFDICIQLDMDEVLSPGWRAKVEEAFIKGNFWPTYKQVTARNPDGSIKSAFDYFKIHPRKGFIWKYPIHEVITPIDGSSHSREQIDVEVDHLQDHTKNRNSYLHLLELAVKESPNDWRMNHYLNREYFYKQDWVKVISTAYQCDEITGGWDIERSSTYIYASEAAHHLGFRPLAKYWAEKATLVAPAFFESWHWRAHIAHLYEEWQDCFDFASKRLSLSRQSHHLVKPEIWEWWGYDLIALSSHRLGLHEDAVKYGKIAADAAPSIDRLRTNLEFYYKVLQESGSVREIPSANKNENLISLITPTRNREDHLASQYSRLLKQTHTKWEWLILDDSATPSPFGVNCKDPRVKYQHLKSTSILTIGEKRNMLIEKASGDWIAHIDDDDIYTESYLAQILNYAKINDLELTYLNTWHFVNEKNEIGRYSSSAVLPTIEGWGFTYLYKKEVGEQLKFPANNWEDHFWFQDVIKKYKYSGIDDEEGIVIKFVHSENTSNFPWQLTSKNVGVAVHNKLLELFNPATRILRGGFNIISIGESRNENKEKLRAQLSSLKEIPAKSFDGRDAEDIANFKDLYPELDTNLYLSKRWIQTQEKRRDGEIGCWISNYHLWRMVLEEFNKESREYDWLLILEDDAMLPEDFDLDKIVSLLCDADILLLGVSGAIGYIISGKGARHLVDQAWTGKGFLSRPVDEYLFELIRWGHATDVRIGRLPCIRQVSHFKSVINEGISDNQLSQSNILSNESLINKFIEMQKLIRPSLSIEVGAHEATFSKKMHEITENVWAFEASPYVFEHFYPISGVNYINKAISNVKGKVDFEIQGERDFKTGNNSILKRNEDKKYSYVEIDAVTLNDTFKNEKNICLWIDCEGANEQVLTGASNILKNVSSIFIEVEEVEYWKGQWLFNDVESYLLENGFILFARGESEYNNKQYNCIFIKKELEAKFRDI